MSSPVNPEPAVYVRIDTPGQVGLFAVGRAPVIEVNAVPEIEARRVSGISNDQHVATLHLKVDGHSILEITTFYDPADTGDVENPAYFGTTPEKAAVNALKDGMKIAENLAALIEEARRNPQQDAWLIFWGREIHRFAWRCQPLKEN